MKSKFKYLFLFVLLTTICMAFVLWLIYHHGKPADITADFGDRTSTITIPPDFFGTGGVGSTVSSQTGIDNMTNVRLLGNRIWINVNTIFPTGDVNAPSWSAWDNQLKRGTQNGLDPLITVWGTPAPTLGVQACSMPTDVNKWAKLAAAAIKHTDAIKPGLWYELWNEPDTGSLCNSTNYLNDYLRLYGALGPLFRAASPTGKFGGPALASSANTTSWIGALTTNASTAPYVEFTSLHIYITGSWLLPNMTWQQAYDTTQNPTAGLAYYYRLFEQTTHKGTQPNAATTPTVISEYNTNYVYSPNNVQNDAIYGPLWNTVAVADFLNNGPQGSVPPAKIIHFMSGDSKGYFCLEGVANGDLKACKQPTDGQPYNAVYVPYPTLLAYQLFCDPTYLNMENGFSVVNPPAAPNSLLTTAFYTAKANSVVIINPTATAVSGLRVKLSHLGIHPTYGDQSVLSNGTLVKSDLKVSSGNSVTLTTDVPAYSTVALTVGQS